MKAIIISLFFIVSIGISKACDFCNCYVSINPLLKKNFIGIRYHYSPYSLNKFAESQLSGSNLNKDDFQELKTIYDFHGQFYPVKKLQVLMSFPYVVNSEKSPAVSEDFHEHTHEHSSGHAHSHTQLTSKETTFDRHTINGISDPLLIANYNIYDKQSNDTALISHSLFVGGGIKIPFGQYKISQSADSHERLHKPGTGSFDNLINISYIAKRKLIGISINSNYFFAGTNSQHYKFGNKFNGKASVFYEIKKGFLYIFPSIGPYIEIADKDEFNHTSELNTGGMMWLSQAALDIYYKKVSINIEFQLPIERQLNGSQSQLDYRIVSGISYAFN
jgi:hypothetical protein